MDTIVEYNTEALKRIVLALVAMAGLRQSAIAGRQPGSDPAAHSPAILDCLLPTADCRPFLPRHLRNAVLRLLRPAEAAARRLIVVAARGLQPPPALRATSQGRPPPPPRGACPRACRRQDPGAWSPASQGRTGGRPQPGSSPVYGGGVAAGDGGGARHPFPRRIPLPLCDPPRRLRILSQSKGRRTVPPHLAPRIAVPGVTPLHRLPPPPSPDDPIDVTRIALRLRALAAALDDLPGQARRFARWKALRERPSRRRLRLSPLRPGRPPGLPGARRPAHPVRDLLADLQVHARDALAPPDTS